MSKAYPTLVPGDIFVEYTDETLREAYVYYVMGFNNNIDDLYDLILIDSPDSMASFYAQGNKCGITDEEVELLYDSGRFELIKANSYKPCKLKCICTIFDLMNLGCKCGGA